jgi:hypothetical protein
VDPRWISSLAVAAIAAGCASVPKPAPNAPPPPSPPQARVVTGLEDATDVVKMYEHDTVEPENAMPTVGGYVRVHAPLAVAYEVATRFGEYADLNPDYIEQSTVVDRHPEIDAIDVYLRVPTVIDEYVWAVVRFRPIRKGQAGYAYRGDEVRGNLDDLRIFWRIVPLGPSDVVAQFEFFADPHLPLPRAWILPEVREGVRIILDRYRSKTEAAALGPLTVP